VCARVQRERECMAGRLGTGRLGTGRLGSLDSLWRSISFRALSTPELLIDNCIIYLLQVQSCVL